MKKVEFELNFEGQIGFEELEMGLRGCRERSNGKEESNGHGERVVLIPQTRSGQISTAHFISLTSQP